MSIVSPTERVGQEHYFNICIGLYQGSSTLFLERYHPLCFHSNPNLAHMTLIIIWFIRLIRLETNGIGKNLKEGSSCHDFPSWVRIKESPPSLPPERKRGSGAGSRTLTNNRKLSLSLAFGVLRLECLSVTTENLSCVCVYVILCDYLVS